MNLHRAFAAGMRVEPVDPSLIHHWPLNEGTGTTFANVVDPTNPINIVDGTGTWGTYDSRTAYRYNQDSSAPAESSAAITISKSLGITIAVDVNRIVNVFYGAFVRIPTIVEFEGSSTAEESSITLPPATGFTNYSMPSSGWQSAVITADADGAQYYLNGSYVADISGYSYINLGDSGIVTLGGIKDFGNTYAFNGALRNLKIWNRSLSDVEVAAL